MLLLDLQPPLKRQRVAMLWHHTTHNLEWILGVPPIVQRIVQPRTVSAIKPFMSHIVLLKSWCSCRTIPVLVISLLFNYLKSIRTKIVVQQTIMSYIIICTLNFKSLKKYKNICKCNICNDFFTYFIMLDFISTNWNYLINLYSALKPLMQTVILRSVAEIWQKMLQR